jgi:hypothetical protein
MLFPVHGFKRKVEVKAADVGEGQRKPETTAVVATTAKGTTRRVAQVVETSKRAAVPYV